MTSVVLVLGMLLQCTLLSSFSLHSIMKYSRTQQSQRFSRLTLSNIEFIDTVEVINNAIVDNKLSGSIQIEGFLESDVLVSELYDSSRIIKKGIPVEKSLNTGDFDNASLWLLKSVTDRIGLYKMKATISSDELQNSIDDCRTELMESKKIFPGFRPGNFPPRIHAKIRSDGFSNCIGALIPQITDTNRLQVCNIQGEPLDTNNLKVVDSMLVPDEDGKSHIDRLTAWKERSPFTFNVMFHAYQQYF